jgi:two-component system nitrate/nitrite response regulator NarL
MPSSVALRQQGGDTLRRVLHEIDRRIDGLDVSAPEYGELSDAAASLRRITAPKSPSAVRLLVAEHRPMLLDAVEHTIMLEPDIAIVGKTSSGERALELIRAEQPAVALVDADLCELSGLEVLEAVVREALDTRVVLLDGAADQRLGNYALNAGAYGYLAWTGLEPSALCAAIKAVANGQRVSAIGMAPTAQSPAGGQPSIPADSQVSLSGRQREILGLLAEGASVAEIASQLELSPATVKSHLHQSYRRLGVHRGTAAVAAARRLGLILA